jgi:site-specific DNA-cytosine methylase
MRQRAGMTDPNTQHLLDRYEAGEQLSAAEHWTLSAFYADRAAQGFAKTARMAAIGSRVIVVVLSAWVTFLVVVLILAAVSS